MKPCRDVAVISDPPAFAALEQEWDDLYQNSPRATLYQSWAWLYSWWEAYGEDYELRLITVRGEDGLLVGLIPLMLERRLGFRRLLFIGTYSSEFFDVLVRRDWEHKVCEAGIRALRQMNGWHVAELREICPTATIWRCLQGWRRPRIDLQLEPCWVIEVKPWEEVLASLSKKSRKMARQTLRSAEQDGVRSVLAEAEDVERAARRLVALHREMRQGRHITQEHVTHRYESFIVSAARRMTARGLGRISEFWRGEEVIVSNFLVFDNDLSSTYVVGASQEAIRRYQWSTLFIWDALNIARSRGCSYVSLQPGNEEYKRRWAKEVPYHEVVLGRGPILSSLSLPILRGYRASPEWAKKPVKWLRQ
jgi:CelD/BcsL family acetyltransferase involved in cellulose biosynthesis